LRDELVSFLLLIFLLLAPFFLTKCKAVESTPCSFLAMVMLHGSGDGLESLISSFTFLNLLFLLVLEGRV
jgi:hypothetical protein